MSIITELRIKAAEKLLLDAVKISDVDILSDLLHDDLLFVVPNGGIITKSMDLDSHRAGTMIVDSLDVYDQQIRIIGDNAIVTMRMETKGKMMSEPISGNFRFIRIWKLLNNNLKVIGGSCTQL